MPYVQLSERFRQELLPELSRAVARTQGTAWNSLSYALRLFEVFSGICMSEIKLSSRMES